MRSTVPVISPTLMISPMVNWFSTRITTPPKIDGKLDEAFWKELPSFYKNFGPTGGDVLCLEKEVWMSDQRWASISAFDYSGKFLRDVFTYTDGNRTARCSAGAPTRRGSWATERGSRGRLRPECGGEILPP